MIILVPIKAVILEPESHVGKKIKKRRDIIMSPAPLPTINKK